jgi:hypothetical protein
MSLSASTPVVPLCDAKMEYHAYDHEEFEKDDLDAKSNKNHVVS